MDFLADARRRAFSLWLRTGRVPRWAKPANPELKFNPWHDPDDGRFTFSGSGRYFGRGHAGDSAARMHERPSGRGRRSEPFGGFAGGGDGFTGGGAGGNLEGPERGPWWDPTGKTPQGRAQGGAPRSTPRSAPRPAPQASPQRGRNEGGSSDRDKTQRVPTRRLATDRSTSRTAEHSTRTASQDASNTRRQSNERSRNWQRIERNGYDFHIDDRGRTRRVEGKLTLNDTQSRSRSAQARAGGSDRRSSDEGGHYIARRFNGPRDAFNHFAQDANFNRGLYRSLEDQWAKALRGGRTVKVKIEPIYGGASRRPRMINVSFWIDGIKRRVKFPNESRERSGAKQ